MSIWLDVAASVPTAHHRDPVGITCPGHHHRHYQPARPDLFFLLPSIHHPPYVALFITTFI
jgi:hypothetical protein